MGQHSGELCRRRCFEFQDEAHEHLAGAGELRVRHYELCYPGFGVEMVVYHDAGRGMVAHDVAQRPHASQLTMVTHDDEVGLSDDRQHLALVAGIDEYALCPRHPLEEVGEYVRHYDLDVSIPVAPQP